jgi:hypothetical protein
MDDGETIPKMIKPVQTVLELSIACLSYHKSMRATSGNFVLEDFKNMFLDEKLRPKDGKMMP